MSKYIPMGTVAVVFVDDKFLKVVPEHLSERADTYKDLAKLYNEVTYLNLPEEGFEDTLFGDENVIEVLLENGYVLSEEDFNARGGDEDEEEDKTETVEEN